MFSSLASFLFGSNTNCETNSQATATGTNYRPTISSDNLVDADCIKISSLTPSVTGAGEQGQRPIVKRGKNKKARQQNKLKGINNSGNGKAISPLGTKQTTLLNPSDSSGEEEFDADEWFIVEKEDEEEDDSPTCNDSKGENVPVIELVKTTPKPINANASSSLAQQRRPQHINSHSLYSGPRPQKQRNHLQKTRNNTNNRSGNGLSVSTLSPSRTVNDGQNGSGSKAAADAAITRSLYLPSSSALQQIEEKAASVANGVEAIIKMEESWFVTPPPCFTSIGPINMEISPYENLLIEHPSMSVYQSIKKSQEATESFIKLDMSVNKMADKENAKKTNLKKKTQKVQSRSSGSAYRLDRQAVDQLKQELLASNVKKIQDKRECRETNLKKNTQAVQSRSSGSAYRLDRQTVDQLKQELLASNVKKIQDKRDCRDICRSAIKRANKVREVQSRNHNQRRADRQHSRIFSNGNNNRKSHCY